MRWKIILFLFVFALLGTSCSKNDRDNEALDLSRSAYVKKHPVKSYRDVVDFNLLDPNDEIPDICKPPYTTDENKLAFVRFRGRVNRCIKQISQTPDLNNFTEVKYCLQEVGRTFEEVIDPTCKLTVMNPLADGSAPYVMRTLLVNFFETKIIPVVNGDRIFSWDNLTDYFSLISVWFNETREDFYALEGQSVVSDLHADEFETYVNKPFWDSLQAYSDEWRSTFGEIVEEVSSTNPDGSARTAEEIAAIRVSQNNQFKIFEAMLTVNQKVLEKVFSSELALQESSWSKASSAIFASPLLAVIVGDALTPFFQRMRVITKIYDIACKLKECSHASYENNKTYWILKFFETLSRGEDIELLDMGDDSSPLVAFLNTMYSNRDSLRDLGSAYADAFSVANIATAISGTDFPLILKPYKFVFEEGYDLISNYEKSKEVDAFGYEKAGLFSSSRISEVNVGFSKSNMDRHITSVRNSNNKLIELREKFASQKHTLIQEVLNINSSMIHLEDLKNNINIDITDLMNEKNQMDAIRHFITESRKEYFDKIKSIVYDPTVQEANRHFVPETPFYYNVLAVNTSQGSNADDISGTTLEKIDQDHQFNKGDILQVSVSGEWSPTCAVMANYGVEMAGAKTGPRGFSLIKSEGRSVVQSTNNYKTQESFSSVTVDTQVCAGAPKIIEGVFGVSAKTCVSGSFGTRNATGTTTSDMTSSSKRSDASFDLGVTLAQTPFSHLPAGTLLLVEMVRGETNKNFVRNIHVLNGNNSFVLNSDYSDYYLIGNDCSGIANSGSLAVQVTRLMPQGSLVVSYASKVSGIVTEIENRVSGLIEEGQLTYQLAENLKAELRGTIGGDINLFSGQMRDLLSSLIDTEIQNLIFKSQLVNMERNFETKKQKLIGLLDQYGLETSQRYLRVGTRNWLLSNMDLDFVNKSDENQNLYTLDRILNTLDHSLVSYLDFKYRIDDKDFILGDVNLLSNLNFSDSFDEISSKITTYVGTLLDRMEDDLNNRPLIPKTTVGIKIPNPFYEPALEIPFPSDGLFPKLSDSKSRVFWETLVNPYEEDGSRKRISLEIGIDDLYAANGLPCYAEAPIVESMGMFFIPENEGYISNYNNSYRHRNSKFFIDGLSSIPFESQHRTYNFVNDLWRFFDVANRMAKSDNDAVRELVSEFSPSSEMETGLATGRPLFGKFEIGDIPSYRIVGEEVFIGNTPIKEIKELFLGYVISSANGNFNVNMNWIPYCSQGESAKLVLNNIKNRRGDL